MAETVPQALLDFLRDHAPFDRMIHVNLAFLAAHLEEEYHPEGEIVLQPQGGQPEYLYILKQGRLGGFEPGDDTTSGKPVFQLEPGDMFPLGALAEERSVNHVYSCVESSFVYLLPKVFFWEMMRRSEIFQVFCTQGLRALALQARLSARHDSSTRLLEAMPLNAAVSDLMSSPPVTCRADATITEALTILNAHGVGSIMVTDEDMRPRGIFTVRDVVGRVVLPGRNLDDPISMVMTPDPETIPHDTPTYEAVESMARHHFTHLPVVREDRVVGVVSERDLFSLQRVSLVQLSRRIRDAPDVSILIEVAREIPMLVDHLITQGVTAEPLTRIITELNDRITQQVLRLELEQAPAGLPVFTWLAFGSEGRKEQTLKTDQDNGMLFLPPEGMSADEVREALLPVAQKINQALAECGFPLCEGGIMAGNPECCLSLEEWSARFSRWIDGGDPTHLLNASIFFDFRVIHGDEEPVRQLQARLFQQAAGTPRFLRFMAENALQNAPPLGLLRDFTFVDDAKHPHTLNLKLSASTPLVDAARIWALQHGVAPANTRARLKALVEMGAVDPDDAATWNDCHEFIQMHRLRLHRRQAERGEDMNNLLDPDDLNALDRRILKETFRQIRKLQSRLALDFQL